MFSISYTTMLALALIAVPLTVMPIIFRGPGSTVSKAVASCVVALVFLGAAGVVLTVS